VSPAPEEEVPPEAACVAKRLGGQGVLWPALGRSRLAPIEVARCSDGEITVDVVASVVSLGTERARYLGLPNADVKFPHRPGYAAAGHVIGVGAGVEGIVVGDQVALLDVPHQSVATVPVERAYRVPSGVAIEDAALLQLGVVAAQGLRRAAIDPGEPFAVIGMGLIGSLAQRLAYVQGSGPCTAITATDAKARLARAGGVDQFIALDRDSNALKAVSLPVVIEATGNPYGLATAIAAAAPRGRVVLLGSPRVLASNLPVDDICRKQLCVVGAHVNGLRDERSMRRADVVGHDARMVLDALANGRLTVSDLFSVEVDPRETELFYWSLVRDRSIIGARFNWTSIPPDSTGRPPTGKLLGRGEGRMPRMDTPIVERPPFADATGHLRFAIIGCGEIAVRNAAAVARAANTSLTACYDVKPELSKGLASAYGAWAAPSLKAVLEQDDVDAVILCLPHHLHAPVAIEAAQAGKHVIVEKPMAIDLESAVRMLHAAEQSRVALSVCFPSRYEATVAEIHSYLRAGAIGELAGLEVRWYADKPPSYFFSGFSGRSPSTWRMRLDQAGGGVLLMNLCHDIELVRHLTGASVSEVMAFTSNTGRVAEVEDSVSVSVSYESGAIGSFVAGSGTRGLRHEAVRIWGTYGQVEVRPHGRMYTQRALDGLAVGRWVRLGGRRQLPARAVYFSRFASSVTSGRKPEVTALDGLAVQAFVEAAYQSATDGPSVRPADLLRQAGAPEEAQ
jgi:predicted dehydrogenase/threonine dehydrogenase-like Zn-dependent dehydrogenase